MKYLSEDNRGRLTHFQVQPVYASRDRWEALASAEGFTYEVLELSVSPALNDPETLELYKEWYLKSGRVTSVHGSFINIDPGCGDEKMSALSRERCRESCALAASLGARNVVFHSSCFPFLRGSYLDFWAGRCAQFYEELAEAYPLNIFIENSPDIDAGPLKALMQRITAENIGVCLDIGHANYSHISLERWFDELHGSIGYLHLSDNEGTYDDHIALGTGTVDWENADRLWRSLDAPVPITLETGNADSTLQSVRFLKENGFFQATGGNHDQ